MKSKQRRALLEAEAEDSHDTISHDTISHDINAYEATELAKIRSRYNVVTLIHRPTSVADASQPIGRLAHLQDAVAKFWRRQICIVVEHSACRDHLGTIHFFLTLHLIRCTPVPS